jgi:hypothetical protein
MKPYLGLTVLGVVMALSSAMFLSQSNRPYNLVAIRFCPKTANLPPRYSEDFSQVSQESLNKKYCRTEQKMLKEIWEQKQFESPVPLPESSFIVREIPASDSNVIWFLIAPIASGLAYLSWAKKSELDELSAHFELEGFKTQIKLIGVSARDERDFKATSIKSNWNKQRVKAGFISVEAMQDRLKRQQEIQDKTHASALKQFDLGDSEMSKGIAENLRDAAKADKEKDKIERAKSFDSKEDTTPSNKQRVNELVEALKNWEDGWLWTVINAIKPIWIVGDMGTGKTNTSVAIGLIRKHCLDIPVFRVADRHLNGENIDVWNLLEATEKADNDSAILEALQDAVERRDMRIQAKLPDNQSEQFIIDEFTQLAKIDKESVERFVSSTFSDTRKAKEYFIGVTHNLTNAAFGDGTAEMRKGAFYLQKFTLDNRKPLPRIVIKTGLKDDQGNNLSDIDKTLPPWFEALKIYGHFNSKPIDFDA